MKVISRITSTLFYTLGLLLLIEVALEYRASKRGWETVLFSKDIKDSQNSKQDLAYGPSTNFIYPSKIVSRKKNQAVVRIWVSSSSHANDSSIKTLNLFPNQLEEILLKNNLKAEIINASFPAQLLAGHVNKLSVAKEWQSNYAILYQMSNDINYIQKNKNRKTSKEIKSSQVNKFFENLTTYSLVKSNITPWLVDFKLLKNQVPTVSNYYQELLLNYVGEAKKLGIKPILMTFATSYSKDNIGAVSRTHQNSIYKFNSELSLDGWVNTISSLNEIIKKTGKSQDVLVIDLAAKLSGKTEYYRDFVHFNNKGHQKVAEIIAEEFLKQEDNEF